MSVKSNKRAKKYDSKLTLKEGVGWNDLIDLSLINPNEKKNITKAKRAKGKKK